MTVDRGYFLPQMVLLPGTTAYKGALLTWLVERGPDLTSDRRGENGSLPAVARRLQLSLVDRVSPNAAPRWSSLR